MESASGSHPYAHLTSSKTSSTIRALDTFAFPPISRSGLHMQPHPETGSKRRKVADVVSSSGKRSEPSSFSTMAGLDHVQREKERARRLRKINPKGEGSSSSPATYQPFSREQLLGRLSTFTIASYTSKPAQYPRLSPLGLAVQGWSQAGVSARNEVQCVTCTSRCTVTNPSAELSAEERVSTWKALEENVFESHKSWCPWKLRGCDPTLYRIKIPSRLATVQELINDTVDLSTCIGIETLLIETPLSDEEIQAFTSAIANAMSSALSSDDAEKESVIRIGSLLSLFGWQTTPVTTSSRAQEKAREASQTTVSCSFCARTVGLWSYLSDPSKKAARAFHVAREHRTFCPYVNGSVQAGTFLPSQNQSATGSTSKPSSQEVVPGLVSSELRRMRSRNSSEVSLQSMVMDTTASVPGSDATLPASSMALLQPGWSLRLNLVLRRTKETADRKLMPPPQPVSQLTSQAANGGELGSQGSASTAAPLRKLKSQELLAKVKSLMGGI